MSQVLDVNLYHTEFKGLGGWSIHRHGLIRPPSVLTCYVEESLTPQEHPYELRFLLSNYNGNRTTTSKLIGRAKKESVAKSRAFELARKTLVPILAKNIMGNARRVDLANIIRELGE